MSRFGSRALLAKLGSLLFELAWKCGLVLLAWSGADYLFQRWNYERSLMMTKQEVKQEMKDTDGNPLIRGRMRRLRRAFLRKMMAKDVARATAVITNPTHYAVALEYRPETMAAPVVVAKGRNLIAEKHQADRALARNSHHRKSTARAGALQGHRSGPVDSAEPLRGSGRNPGLPVSRRRCACRRQTRRERSEITMATADQTQPTPRKKSSGDWLLPVAAVALVFMMLVPVPSIVLDLFLATSVTLGVIVLLSALYILKPVQFSVFPTLLLLLTLLRISLNIASSRRILLHGNEGAGGCGPRDRGLRAIRRRRQLRGGLRDLPGVDRHSVSGDQPRRGAHRRSGRALHVGRPARQADGDRRGHERRPDRRSASARPPRT